MKCPNCGNKISRNAKYCPYCGIYLKTDSSFEWSTIFIGGLIFVIVERITKDLLPFPTFISLIVVILYLSSKKRKTSFIILLTLTILMALSIKMLLT
nr:zinc ribbon domain-containing protein [Methanothermus fervidus]